MKQLRPDGRLSLCAEYVRKGSRLADIGTDHAYLPIALCQSGKIPSALACDINPLPLKSAEENIAAQGLTDKVKVRLSDGLKELSAEDTDDIVIAGMGGELIAAILNDCRWIRDPSKNLILQPMTRHDALIRWLYDNGFRIIQQGAAKDGGKYYTVMRASYDGKQRTYDAADTYIGRLLPDSEASVGFLTKTLGQLKKQMTGDPSLSAAVETIEEMLK